MKVWGVWTYLCGENDLIDLFINEADANSIADTYRVKNEMGNFDEVYVLEHKVVEKIN